MKIRFKHQPYQAEAVASVVDCFEGQPRREGVTYRVDPGRAVTIKGQQRIAYDEEIETGFKNRELSISENQLLQNIREVQRRQNLSMDSKLIKTSVCPVNLDIEMETGTGKTYVYLRTIFEMNRLYGFTKFIIVVPSVAIKEGVYKSLQMTEEHFKGLYDNVQFDYFVYDYSSRRKRRKDFRAD